MDGLGELLTLIGKGGSVAQVAALWFLYQIWRDARMWAKQFGQSLESIKRAVIVSNPKTARVFEEKPLNGTGPAPET